MAVREWDPASATDAEIESVVAALNEVLATDLPGDPHWQNTGMREYLSETMPGERRVCWLTDGDPPGRATGHANLLLLGDIGVVEVLVHPGARHQGVGSALLDAVVRRAYSEGLASIGVEAVGGTPAMKFWESLGFRCPYVEMRSVLDLSTVDRGSVRAMAAAPDGYRVEFHPGGLPDSLLEAYAAAKASRREAESGELELRPSSYDAQRLAESLTTLNRRGMKPYLVLAVHEPSGAVAALTEVVTPAQHPSRADQYDTIVAPAHQGRGLERTIKARMLTELRAVEPRVTEVQTWNALANDPMAEVNAELGFHPDREWREYEADVLDLVRQLNTAS
ncbi:MAG: GNAT family N-acetyltransferase [Micromonosporaceae bacterium]|nr:GNAT family N-acetyltransferase [Micromonosporaceae bacterium]